MLDISKFVMHFEKDEYEVAGLKEGVETVARVDTATNSVYIVNLETHIERKAEEGSYLQNKYELLNAINERNYYALFSNCVFADGWKPSWWMWLESIASAVVHKAEIPLPNMEWLDSSVDKDSRKKITRAMLYVLAEHNPNNELNGLIQNLLEEYSRITVGEKTAYLKGITECFENSDDMNYICNADIEKVITAQSKKILIFCILTGVVSLAGITLLLLSICNIIQGLPFTLNIILGVATLAFIGVAVGLGLYRVSIPTRVRNKASAILEYALEQYNDCNIIKRRMKNIINTLDK